MQKSDRSNQGASTGPRYAWRLLVVGLVLALQVVGPTTSAGFEARPSPITEAGIPINTGPCLVGFSSIFDLGNGLSVSPFDQHLVASGNNVYVGFTGNLPSNVHLQAFFDASNDGGTTFGPPINLSNDAGNSGSPVIGAAGSNVYATWEELLVSGRDGVIFRASNNNGTSFGPEIGFNIGLFSLPWPSIAASRNNVYLAWANDSSLVFRKSGDAGATFDSPLILSRTLIGTSSIGPDLVGTVSVAGVGNHVYVSYVNATTASATAQVAIRVSIDNGASFSAPTILGDIPESVGVPSMAVAGSNVYVTWTQASELLFTMSSDGGATFSNPVNLGNVGALGTPGSPVMVASDNNVYVGWDYSGSILFRASNDWGVTFGNTKDVRSNVPQFPSLQMSASGGIVYLLWNEVISSTGFQEVFLTRSKDYGVSFSFPVEISGDGLYDSDLPRVAISGIYAHLIWYSDTSYGDIRYGRTRLDVDPVLPDFSISASPSSVSIYPSQNATSTITVQSINPDCEEVFLSATWLTPGKLPPSGMSVQLGSKLATPPAGNSSSILTLSATASPAPGTFVLRINSTDLGGVVHSVDVQVTSSPPPPDYHLSSSPPSLSIGSSQSKTLIITIQPINGFSDTVDLTTGFVGGSPNGLTVQPSSSQVVVSQGTIASTTFTLTTQASPSPGTFGLRITGLSSSGKIKHTLDTSVIISPSSGTGVPSCGCTLTGPFTDPRVETLVGADAQGYSPYHSSRITVDSSGDLTLTRLSDGKTIVYAPNTPSSGPSAFGFSPDGKNFVLIMIFGSAAGPSFTLSLYNVPAGKTVIDSLPNPVGWGFSPNSKFFLVASHPATYSNTQVLLSLYNIANSQEVLPGGGFTLSYSQGLLPYGVDEGESYRSVVWGFSPNGNSFVLAYMTPDVANKYSILLFNTTTGSIIFESDYRSDYRAFWQFSPCSDLLMFATQANPTPSRTDPVLFLSTSSGTDMSLVLSSGGVFLDPSISIVSSITASVSSGSTNGASFNIELTGTTTTVVTSPQCSVSVAAHSPVNIVVIDVNGLRTGFDPAGRGVVAQVPGSNYTGVGSEPQIVTLPYSTGQFWIEAFGSATLSSSQKYSVTISTRGEVGETIETVSLSATAFHGSDQGFSFSLNGRGSTESTGTANVTSLSLHLSSATTVSDQPISILGSLTPPTNMSITLIFSAPDGSTFARSVALDENGSFAYQFAPSQRGNWNVQAIWTGDQSHLPARSDVLSFQANAPVPTPPGTPQSPTIFGLQPVQFFGVLGGITLLLAATVVAVYKRGRGREQVVNTQH